ncbi:MAG TPA: glycosyltransferase, partial [Acidimicrobiia bacterium]
GSLLGPERAERFETTAATARALLEGHSVLNVNSTATGGGVAELLQTLLAYARGAGVDARWVVIEGNPRFFEITKRVHNHLYGTPGDGGPLGSAERRDYEETLHRNVSGLLEVVGTEDIVVLHDPQTAGLAAAMRRAGARVVWRCHIGIDTPNEHSERGWEFLRPYVEEVGGYVFSCEWFAPAWVPRHNLAVIAPSIDPFSAKNEPIAPELVAPLLQYVGLLGGGTDEPVGMFTRRDGSQGRVTRRVDLLGTGPPPPPDVPIVLQASRWDALKDMPGVLTGFADSVVDRTDAHLVLAGPQTSGVADDPEANAVLLACVSLWRALPRSTQRRIHLACVPMDDPDEAAAIVNALQRHATIVVQKSIAEGFGLTVAEAMWKSRPVIGSAVGGIVDQIVSGETGLLLDDARNLEHCADSICSLLDQPAEGSRMGSNGRQRAAQKFLGDRHLAQWAQLFARLHPR